MTLDKLKAGARSWLFVAPAIAFSTIFCGTISILAWMFRAGQAPQIEIARKWARSLLLFAGVKVKVEGFDKIDPRGSYVFVSNHLSYMDTPVVFSSIPVQFRFLAKKGLFQIPFLGWHLSTAGHIPVFREDPRASLRTLSRAAELIQAQRISLLIFPEGGRAMDGELGPFKDGAAYLAIKAQAPIVPLAVLGTREVLPMGSAILHSGRVLVRIGDPLPTAGLMMHDRKTLTEAARQRVAAMLIGSEAQTQAQL